MTKLENYNMKKIFMEEFPEEKLMKSKVKDFICYYDTTLEEPELM